MSFTDKPGDDGIVMSDEMMDKAVLKPSELPDADELSCTVKEVLSYTGGDDMVAMRGQDREEFERLTKERFHNFSERYPSVFDLVVSGSDTTMLYEMLSKIKDAKSGSATIQSVEKVLSNKLAEKYIYPNLSKEQERDIRKKVAAKRKGGGKRKGKGGG